MLLSHETRIPTSY